MKNPPENPHLKPEESETLLCSQPQSIVARNTMDCAPSHNTLTKTTTEGTELAKTCETSQDKPKQDETPEEYFEKKKPEESQPPREQLTTDQYKKRIRDTLSKVGERERDRENAGTETYLVTVPEHVRELARVFLNYKSRPPLKSEDKFWRSSWDEQYELNITPDAVKRAIEQMKNDGLTIKSPKSVTGIAEELAKEPDHDPYYGAEVWQDGKRIR